MILNGNEYKLLYLDSNVLREMVVTPNILQNFSEKFLTENYMPCFSIYNIIELRNKTDIFEKFLNMWSSIPCFLIFPYKAIVLKERLCYEGDTTVELDNDILYAFDPSRDIVLSRFIEKIYESDVGTEIKKNLASFETVVVEWEKLRESNSKLTTIPLYSKIELRWVVGMAETLGIHNITMLQLKRMPALRMICYSHFRRTLNPRKEFKKNDVMDVMISAIYPYVDAIVSENAQIEINKQSRKLIPEMKGKELYTLKDVRLFKKD